MILVGGRGGCKTETIWLEEKLNELSVSATILLLCQGGSGLDPEEGADLEGERHCQRRGLSADCRSP